MNILIRTFGVIDIHNHLLGHVRFVQLLHDCCIFGGGKFLWSAVNSNGWRQAFKETTIVDDDRGWNGSHVCLWNQSTWKTNFIKLISSGSTLKFLTLVRHIPVSIWISRAGVNIVHDSCVHDEHTLLDLNASSTRTRKFEVVASTNVALVQFNDLVVLRSSRRSRCFGSFWTGWPWRASLSRDLSDKRQQDKAENLHHNRTDRDFKTNWLVASKIIDFYMENAVVEKLEVVEKVL